MKNFLNILIDGNFLFYKTLMVTKGYNNKYNENNKYLEDPNEIAILVRKVAMDLVYTLSKFQHYNRIIFVTDSKSWRKDIDINQLVDTNFGYKANRTGVNDINMELFYEAINDFVDILNDNNIIISKINKAEGDDLLKLWATYLNTNKEDPQSVMIFTGDGDIQQVVNFYPEYETFTVIYSNSQHKETLYAKTGFLNWIKNLSVDKKEVNPYDMFNMDKMYSTINSNSINIINTTLKQVTLTEVNPNEISMYKILCGDSSDNVPSVWNWVNNKNTKMRITTKHFNKVWSWLLYKYGDFQIKDYIDDSNFINKIRIILQESAKIVIPTDLFEQRFRMNTKLVYLNESQMPESIINTFNDEINIKLENCKFTPVFDNIELLENTKYKKKNIRVESSIFQMGK